MSDSKLTQDDVQQILRLIQSAEHVAAFHLKFGDVEIGLSRGDGDARGALPAGAPAAAAAATPGPAHPAPAAQPASPASRPPAAKPAPGDATPPGAVLVKAPMVGTFYRSPAPGSPPFVEVGARVQADSTVCIIEVMKLMNSISAGVDGTVREIRVGDAEPVEFGQVLIVIEPER